MLAFGEITFTFGEIMFTFGEITEDFRVLELFLFAAGGGFGTLWVGGPRRGFKNI